MDMQNPDIMELLGPWSSFPALCFEAFLVLGITLFWRRYSTLSDVPGPFLASMTRLWHVKQIKDGNQKRELIRLHDELGSFVRIAPNEVSVVHPDGPRKILLAPLRKGPFYEGITFPDSSYVPAFAIVDPREKIGFSKLLASAYTVSNLLRSEKAMDRQIDSLVGWLDKYSLSGEPMELSEFFTFTAFDLVGEVVFSKPFGYLQKGADIKNSLRQGRSFAVFTATMLHFPWLMKIFTSAFVASLKLMPSSLVTEKPVTALNERKANPDARYDYVAHWLEAHKKHPDKLTAKGVQASVTTHILAGSDTVSCALQSFVYHSIRRPGTWEKLQEEIDAAMKQGLCQDPVVSFEHAKKLPYLQATIKESMRIFTPATVGVPRIAPPGGITIGERTFKAGTILSVYLPGILTSPEIWGPDARVFKPERWLEEGIAALQNKYFIPFSLGYSSCPGQNLARIELSKVLPTVVRDYNIRQVDPAQEWTYMPYVTVLPGDWPVYITKRKMH